MTSVADGEHRLRLSGDGQGLVKGATSLLNAARTKCHPPAISCLTTAAQSRRSTPMARTPATERNERALQAMAEAARRAREARGLPPLRRVSTPDTDRGQRTRSRRDKSERQLGDSSDRLLPESDHSHEPDGSWSGPDPDPTPVSLGRAESRTEKVLRSSVVIVGGLVLVLGAVLVGLHVSGSSASRPTSVAGQATQPRSTTLSQGPSTPATRPPGTNVTSPTPPPVVASPGPVDAPQLASVVPETGRAGQVVTVSGTNLFSPDARVQAFLGGQPALTRCPTQTSCAVTVLALAGSPTTVPLTIETEAGTSNALSFSYGGPNLTAAAAPSIALKCAGSAGQAGPADRRGSKRGNAAPGSGNLMPPCTSGASGT